MWGQNWSASLLQWGYCQVSYLLLEGKKLNIRCHSSRKFASWCTKLWDPLEANGHISKSKAKYMYLAIQQLYLSEYYYEGNGKLIAITDISKILPLEQKLDWVEWNGQVCTTICGIIIVDTWLVWSFPVDLFWIRHRRSFTPFSWKYLSTTIIMV